MPDARQRIEELAMNFVSELQKIAREEVVRVLDGTSSSTPGRAKRATSGAGKRSRGQKRSHKALGALQTKALAVIKAKPGLRIEQINEELGVGTGELALPIKKLLAARAIRTTGQRRATRYSVAGSAGGKKTAKSKRSKRR